MKSIDTEDEDDEQRDSKYYKRPIEDDDDEQQHSNKSYERPIEMTMMNKTINHMNMFWSGPPSAYI